MKKRVGRGGKRGTYSGRGIKGQRSRAGRRIRPQLRDLLMKLPKKRGHKAKRQPRFLAVVNLDRLERTFAAGESVNPQNLLVKKLISKISGKIPTVKILGRGTLTKKLKIENCRLSQSAKAAIEKAGGVIL